MPLGDRPGVGAVVLVVDDDADRRAALRELFRDRYDVREAATGPEAVTAVERGRVDLVLLYTLTPGMSAIETCRAIRAIRPDGAFLPVLHLGSLSLQECRNEALEAGASELLPLSIDPTELSLRVAALLRIRCEDVARRADLAEIRRVSGLKDDLVAFVAHDLRSPIASVLSLLEVVRGEVTDPAIQEDLEVARSSAERAREIAGDLLQARLLERGELSPARAPSAVDAIVADAIRTLDAAVQNHRTRIRVAKEGDPTFPVDVPLLRRAIGNLILNAVRHSPKGATVEVTIRRHGAALEIDVVDRGPAIRPEACDALSDTFSPAERPKSERRANGLGLFLARLVAEAHGGAVSVHDAPGGGALFRLRLEAAARRERVPGDRTAVGG